MNSYLHEFWSTDCLKFKSTWGLCHMYVTLQYITYINIYYYTNMHIRNSFPWFGFRIQSETIFWSRWSIWSTNTIYFSVQTTQTYKKNCENSYHWNLHIFINDIYFSKIINHMKHDLGIGAGKKNWQKLKEKYQQKKQMRHTPNFSSGFFIFPRMVYNLP